VNNDLIILGSAAVGLAALLVLVHGVAAAFRRPSTPTIPDPKAPSIMAITLPTITTLEGYAADPIVQLILVNLLTEVATKVEAATTDKALAQLEALGFALVINRLKALAVAPAVAPIVIPAVPLSK
jgi:hypothetical protein